MIKSHFKQLCLSFLLMISPSSFAASQPNVILILADDLGAGGLHCYGNALLETPNIDQMAKDGMKFTQGLSAYPTCKPSRAAIISGQYGPRTGVYRVSNKHIGSEDKIKYKVPVNGNLPLESTSLAEAFKSAGYKTALFGKWHASNDGDGHPSNHGFDLAYSSTGHITKIKTVPPIDIPKGTSAAEFFTAQATQFIETSHNENKPFFLYLPYYLVHKPLEAKAEYIKHFEQKYADQKLLGKHPDEAHMLAAMTKVLDDCVGTLNSKLDQLGISENTIIVFTSDNGSYDENFTGDFRGSKGMVNEGGMRVPYIFKWPKNIAANSVSNERIIGVDLYPSLLNLAGVTLPENHILDGADFSALLLGDKSSFKAQDKFCFYPKYAKISKKSKRWIDSWRNVIYSGDLKLIEYPEYNEYELFDVAKDQREENNLTKSQPEKTEELKKKLHQWLDKTKSPKLELNPDFVGIK